MTEKEALKLALEALEANLGTWSAKTKVIPIIREALAQPEQELTTTLEASIHAGLDKKNDKNPQVDHQGKHPEHEPVALQEVVYDTIIKWDENDGKRSRRELARRIVSLYTTPPQRTWVGLTDEEFQYCVELKNPESIAEEVEAKLKEKNT